MSSICLNMIVKNEAVVITRCLDSVKGFISKLYILDTGSTDNTMQAIADWCKLNNVEGVVAQSEFHNFAQARNEALQGALNSGLSFTHILFLDAGMEIVWGRTPLLDMNLQPGFHFTINQKYGELLYANSRIVCRNLPVKWVGVCHEYLECPQPALLLNDVHILCHSDGGNQTGQMERYRDLLHQGLKDEPDNTRYMFYLAQTYFDLEQWRDAAFWYGRRITKAGWEEETWYAMFKMARARANTGDFSGHEVISYFLVAFYYRPTRVEPLVYLGRYLGQEKLPVGVFRKPNDVLFVEDELYAK